MRITATTIIDITATTSTTTTTITMTLGPRGEESVSIIIIQVRGGLYDSMTTSVYSLWDMVSLF